MRKTLILVAFGDSLTVGFQSPTPNSPWPETTPYTRFLEQMIEDTLKRWGRSDALSVQIHNKGVNGDLTSYMLIRFKRDVIDLKPSYVIILGGSNDIGWGVPPIDVFNNLRDMYVDARENGVEPIACAVPSILGFDPYIQPRMELNKLVKEYCLKREMACVDLFTATSDPQTHRLLKEYSNDGLHLNTRGYEKIAETIYREAIEEIITSLMEK